MTNLALGLQALRALRTVREDYPDAFLAGGFLRDAAVGITPKDLDFFTFLPLKEDEKQDEKREPYADERILAVADRKIPDVVFPVQIIQLSPEWGTTVEEQVAAFALGAQQAYYTGNTVQWSDAFADDLRDQTLTVTSCRNENEAKSVGFKVYSLDQRGYATWALQVPTEFQEYRHIIYHYATRVDTFTFNDDIPF